VPASTYEKCTHIGTILNGPSFINEAVERELDIYKKEVEEKSLSSFMNNNYVFPRKIR
jgi:hypothetical protein